MQLVIPSREYLVAVDSDAFLVSLVNREAAGMVTLPDGSEARPIPGYRRWMWKTSKF